MTETFPILERAIADQLGLSRAVVREARKKLIAAGTLKTAEDWRQRPEGIAYSEEGAQRLTEALTPAKSDDLGEDLKKNSAPREGELVMERPTRNHRIVLCRDETGQLVRMKVRSSEFFVKGMRCPARQVQGDLWILKGRGPRKRGKW